MPFGRGGRINPEAEQMHADVPLPEVETAKRAERKGRKPPGKPRDWRETTSTMLECAGIAAVTAGFWLIAPFWGLIILGVSLIIMGVATSRTWDSEDT